MKLASNLEMYKLLRSNLYIDNKEGSIKTFTLPLKVEDFIHMEGVYVSYVLHLAQECTDVVCGVYFINVIASNKKKSEAIVVLVKRKDKDYELRVAIKTKQAVGGVVECIVNNNGTTTIWPTEPFSLHTLILSQYNHDVVCKAFGDVMTPVSRYVYHMESAKRYGFMHGVDLDATNMLYNGGNAYQWYLFLKDQSKNNKSVVKNKRNL